VKVTFHFLCKFFFHFCSLLSEISVIGNELFGLFLLTQTGRPEKDINHDAECFRSGFSTAN